MNLSHLLPQAPRALLVLVVGCALSPRLVEAAPSWRARPVAAHGMAAGAVIDRLAADELRGPDRAFVSKAMETGRQHIRLADVGLSQAGNSDVRSHAMQLAADYRRLNEALDALIRRKGGIANAPVGGTSETYNRLLEKSGEDFDRDFIQAVSELTDDTLALFEQATSSARDPDVRSFASAQLPILREHRNRAIELKKTVG